MSTHDPSEQPLAFHDVLQRGARGAPVHLAEDIISEDEPWWYSAAASAGRPAGYELDDDDGNQDGTEVVYRSFGVTAPLPNVDSILAASPRSSGLGCALTSPSCVASTHAAAEAQALTRTGSPVLISKEMPTDALAHIFFFLDPYPDLFALCAVSRALRTATTAHLVHRRTVVAAGDTRALTRAVADARPGTTVALAPGLHHLATTLVVDVPMRIESKDSKRPGTLVSLDFVAIRARASVAVCFNIGIERRLATGTFPNSAVHVEGGCLHLNSCVVTGALSPHSATRGRNGLACNAPNSMPARPPLRRAGASTNLHRDAMLNALPQTGISVSPRSEVNLKATRLSHHRGPALKVCRGLAHVSECTISKSGCGPNVVANGGFVTLLDSEVHASRGDGVTLWNDATAHIERNHIHSNHGAGISINSSGGQVHILNNCIQGNDAETVRCAANCVLRGNTYDGGSQDEDGVVHSPALRAVEETVGRSWSIDRHLAQLQVFESSPDGHNAARSPPSPPQFVPPIPSSLSLDVTPIPASSSLDVNITGLLPRHLQSVSLADQA
mmetsp:Transcript_9889/g.26864  ORF Transcript_9889/g.26864 Transcript_9889/m.26864 type:complete len:557 (+) Transcript_9889:80-1750(+)|eukprot:CAMPEP_0185188898 /NCGR_PEP_ID=MMETSP1140-20130426/5695_1 /TAXON_ID=298111 /ORGANISM="Pavlova sp., Strain CCMP459" /LENGTH=556 /DNA_ID=CAMNT_0027755415 /DNA_START=80 /DNA_END=1750 /DNA_ORIENTATION=-